MYVCMYVRAVLCYIRRKAGPHTQTQTQTDRHAQPTPALRALAAEAAGQLHVLHLNGDALGVDGAQVGVLKETHQVVLRGLLQGQQSGALHAQVGLEVLGDLAHQALEGQLADEQLRGLLVAADLAQRHCARAEAVGLLDTRHGRGLLRRLGGELLARRLAAGALARSMLGAGHGGGLGGGGGGGGCGGGCDGVGQSENRFVFHDTVTRAARTQVVGGGLDPCVVSRWDIYTLYRQNRAELLLGRLLVHSHTAN